MKFGIGQSVKRTEDIRFVTGQGQYTDDLRFDNETLRAFPRARPQAHAKIKSIDISAAKAAPGVIDGADLCRCRSLRRQADAVHGAGARAATVADRNDVAKPILAKDKVTFTGEAIAMVIAETYAAGQAMRPNWSRSITNCSMPPARSTAAPNGPQIWDRRRTIDVFDWADGEEAAVNAAFAKAAHTSSLDVVQNRVSRQSDGDAQRHRRLRHGDGRLHALFAAIQGSRRICAARIAQGVLNLPTGEGARHHARMSAAASA